MEEDSSLDSATAAILAKHTVTSGEPETDAKDEEAQDQPEQPQGDEGEEGDPEQDPSDEQDEPEQEADEPDPKPSAIDNAIVKVRVGDQEKEVTVSELKRGYLRESDYTRKTQEVSEARKQFVGQAKQYEAHIAGQLQEIGFLSQTLMQQLVADEQGTDWNELRTKNPAEYAAKQHDVQQRRQLLERSYRAYQEAQQRNGALGTEEYHGHLAEQAEQLKVLIPEWIDSRVRTTEQKQVAKFLLDMGVPEQSVSALADARTVAIARMAMMWKNQQSQRDKAKEKLKRPVPSLQKSGVRDPNPNRSAQQKMIQRANKTGKTEDFAEVLASKYR